MSTASKTEWASKPGVVRNSTYRSTLVNGSDGLYWYAQIQGAFSQISAAITRSISSAFSDPNLINDPMFLVKQLSKGSMAAAGLEGTETASRLDALMRECADTRTGKVLSKDVSMVELFDLNKPGCAENWSAFQGSLGTFGDNLLTVYKPGIVEKMKAMLQHDTSTVKNVLVANAIMNYAKDRAGFTATNSLKNPLATFSDGNDRVVEDFAEGPVSSGFMYMLEAFMSDPHSTGLKAEAAQKFNQISSLIPAARGWIHGLLAILFVFAVLLMGFGVTKYFFAWITAIATVSLYQPFAVLGYKIAEYFTNKSNYSRALDNFASDPLLLSGVNVMREQLAHVQTVYLAFEMGTFMVFMVGGIRMFNPMMNLTGRLGAMTLSRIGGLASTLATQYAYAQYRAGSGQNQSLGGGASASGPAASASSSGGPSGGSGGALQVSGGSGSQLAYSRSMGMDSAAWDDGTWMVRQRPARLYPAGVPEASGPQQLTAPARPMLPAPRPDS
ncbi:MAG TPA: hypothetical protein VE954_00710 [Oligoflexus sp.]|uniref:hypothetical protein n=1 Tax=Oligoflexus sp. TaxID=1971216 RepID=UPI002D261D4A|nr:hypothetical protein [Oligoflexus sp.]HYX31600.1 hypothetical protein [Oligoflexus sp.]